MKNLISLSLIVSLGLVACNSTQQEQATATDTSMTIQQDTTATVAYTVEMVDNKKDPTCGMPVSAGISDTAHYKDKVIGFCSAECKDEFKKAPEANIAAAEIK